MNMITGSLKKAIYFTATAAAVLLMSSCPQQITAPLVALVEDQVAPVISVTSPRGGDNYYSAVTVTGTITDSVTEESDSAGRISEIYYKIANDEFRRGKIIIGLDDTVSQDENYGSGIIDFDIKTGTFSFTFSTVNPNTLRDLLSLTITAVDSNANETVQQINLLESNGPYVEFDFYSAGDYDIANKITALSGDRVWIGGYVGNSDYQNTVADEIVEISWTVSGTSLGATLDVRTGSSDWNTVNEVFETTNAFEDTEFFRYDPARRFFYTETFIDVEEGSKNFQVTAVDAYGHSTTIDQLLTPPASLMLATPTSSRTHYSTNPDISTPRTITISSKVTDPNDGLLTLDQIESVQCSFTSTAQETAPTTVSVYTRGTQTNFDNFFSMSTEPGRFDFNISTNDWPGNAGAANDGGTAINLTGDIYAKITVEDNKGKTKNKSVLIQRDDVSPSISNIGFTGGTGNFVKRDDILNLTFTAADSSGSGVSTVNLVEINSTPVTASVVKTGDNCSVSYSVPSDATSSAGGDQFGYNIRVYDDAGNEATNTDPTAKTLYGPYSPNDSFTSASLVFESNNERNSVYYGRATSTAYDTITVEFESHRVLQSLPTATIANKPATVQNTEGLKYKATYTLNNSETTLTEGDQIPFSINVTDIVGNVDLINNSDTATVVYYDNVSPGQTETPTLRNSSEAPPYNADLYINNAESGSVEINVAYGTSGTVDGDTVELFLDESTDVLLGSITATNTTSDNIPVSDGGLLGDDGPKNLYILVTDKAGNRGTPSQLLSPTLNTDIPVADATGNAAYGSAFTLSPDPGTLSSDIASYSWSVSGSGSTAGASVDASNADTQTISIDDFSLDDSYTDNADGNYTARLNVVDTAGNPGIQSSHSFIWDEVRFTQTISAESDGSPISDGDDISEQATFSTTITGDESGIASHLWDVKQKPASATVTFGDASASSTTVNVSEDGTYVIRLTSTDGLGRADLPADAPTLSFTMETTPPYFTNTVSDKGSIKTGFTETATADDDGSGVNTGTYQWTVVDTDNASNEWTPAAGAALIVNDTGGITVPDGNYTATCTVFDNAGNQCLEADRLSFNFTWDTTVPQIDGSITPTTTGSGSYDSTTYIGEDGTLTLTFDLTDLTAVNSDSVTVRIYSPESTAYIDETFTNITPAGNTFSVTHDFTGDTSDTNGTAINYTITGADTLSVPNSGTIASGTLSNIIYYGPYGSTAYTGLSSLSDNGTDNTWARAVGSNFDTVSISFNSSRILTGKPVVRIAGRTVPSGDVTYTESSGLVTASLLLDGSNETTADGALIPFEADFTDIGSNTKTAGANTTVRYDKSLPAKPGTPSYTPDTSGYINAADIDDGSITFNVTGLDAGTTTLYINDGSDDHVLTTTTSSGDVALEITGTPAEILTKLGGDGTGRTIFAQTTDAAGNTGPVSDTLPVIVDTTVAEPAITVAAAYASSFTIACSNIDSDVGTNSYTWSVTDVASPGNTDSVSVSYDGSVSDGTKSVTLYVTDNAGNQSATASETFIWDADVFTLSLDQNATFHRTSFQITATASDNESGIQTNSYSWSATTTPSGASVTFTPINNSPTIFNNTNSKDGTYTVRVTATDNLGRANSNTAETTFTWDQTAPTDTSFPTSTQSNGAATWTLDPGITDNISAPANITFAWTVTGPTGPYNFNTPTITLNTVANSLVTGTYTVRLVATDQASNQFDDSFSLNWDSAKSLSYSSPAIYTGSGSSGSGSAGTPGRINTFDFTETSPDGSALSQAVKTDISYSRPAATANRMTNYYTAPATGEPETAARESTASKTGIEEESVVLTDESAAPVPGSALKSAAAAAAASSTSGKSPDKAPAEIRNGVSLPLLLTIIFIPAAAVLIFLRKRRQ